MESFQKPAKLLSILIALAIITLSAQITFFIIHYKVSELVDSLVQSSLKLDFFHWVIIGPIIGFLVIQLIFYALFILWVWFLTKSYCEFFHIKEVRQNLV